MNQIHALRALGIALAVVAISFVALASAEEEKKQEFPADKGPATVDVSAFPPKIQEAYKTFAAKCSKCHTLARPINTDMTAENWKLYVKKMMNKPDSGISPGQGKEIYSFLKYYQGVKDEKRGAKGKGGGQGQ